MTKPQPDSKEWWQEVAQGLGVKLFEANGRIATLEAGAAEQRGDARGGQWQDIATAPKNGTRILLLWQHAGEPRMAVGSWHDDKYSAKPRPYWHTDETLLMGMTYTRSNQPTHWQPLPSPPQAASSQEEGS